MLLVGNNLDGLFDAELLSLSITFNCLRKSLVFVLSLVVEQVFGDLHPQLLPDLLVLRLISVLHCQIAVVDLQRNLDCLVIVVQYGIDNDLGTLLHLNLVLQVLYFLI